MRAVARTYSTSLPRLNTVTTSRIARMSFEGSALNTTRLASLPGAMEPLEARPMARAAFEVAAASASIGVSTPLETSSSIS